MMVSPFPSDTSLLGKIAEFTEILARDPQSTAFVALADTYRRLGMVDEALEIAEQGVKFLPSFAPGYVILGRISLERKDADRAVALLQKALTLDPASLPAMHGLARILIDKGEKGRAKELLQTGIKVHPHDSGLQQILVSLALPSASGGGATKPAPPKIGTSRPEDDPIATSTIAEIYLKQGLPQRALKVYRDLLQANPADDRLRSKIRELEAVLAAGVAGPGASAGTAPVLPVAATRPSASPQSRYLQLLDRWLVAVRERKADVR